MAAALEGKLNYHDVFATAGGAQAFAKSRTGPSKPAPQPAIFGVPEYTIAMEPCVHRTNAVTLGLRPRRHGNSED
jgi:hypothetical protein